MTELEIAVVVPLGRPQFREELLSMFAAQTYPAKHLIFIEGAPSPGDGRNAGIDEARRMGVPLFACWDDDDLYSPEYLAEAVSSLAQHQVVGKVAFTVLDTLTGERLHMGGDENTTALCVPGGTICGHVATAVPFLPWDHSEDTAWCQRMRAHGHTIWSTSSRNYVKRQYGPEHRHAWPDPLNSESRARRMVA